MLPVIFYVLLSLALAAVLVYLLRGVRRNVSLHSPRERRLLLLGIYTMLSLIALGVVLSVAPSAMA